MELHLVGRLSIPGFADPDALAQLRQRLRGRHGVEGYHLLGGVQLMLIGVLGEYLGRIYDEVKGRPLYLVADEVGGGADGDGAPR